jgi:fermentation-respiration switch protein FrsA (DUF1100 family)
MPRTIHQTTLSKQRIPHGCRIDLEFRTDGDLVPGVLMLPDGDEPAPAALLLHGYSSRKEHLADSIGRGLLGHGIANLAIDLPLHGSGSHPLQARSLRNPLQIASLWRTALGDGALATRYLAAHPRIDGDSLAVVGYSMGAFLAVQLAAAEHALRAVALAAGGDLPSGTPQAGVARMVADPLRAVRKLRGRPLLMVHRRWDRTVTPDQAERLFAAAEEPKEIRWWDAGHYLPHAAIDEAAQWLATRLATA